MENFSLTDIKKKNYSDVYHCIYHNSAISNQGIVTALSMSRPTVTQHINSLLEEGLIEDCGQLDSLIGRKAKGYQIIPDAQVAIGIEILTSGITIAALNLYGQIIDYKKVSLDFSSDENYVLKLSLEVERFIKNASFDDTQILGIGLGIQGLVSEDGTRILYGKILSCTGLTIDLFQKHLQYPCRFIHDAECSAMSELWEHPEIDDAIFFSLGYHLGGAMIVNGKIHSGRTGRSGTFEHMTLYPDGLPCYCGQKGCAESYCSVNAFLEGNETLEYFFEKKKNQDEDAVLRWKNFLHHLARAINNLHMTFDSQVILGGQLVSYVTEEDLSYLHQEISHITAFPEEEPFIFAGKSKKHVVAIGAALPYVKRFLSDI